MQRRCTDSTTVRIAAIFAAAVLAIGGGVALAQLPQADDAIQMRRGAYALQGHYFSALKPMVTGNAPFDAEHAQLLLQRIEALLPMTFELFPEGSDQGDTKARAEIWSQPEGFAERQERAISAVRTLLSTAQAGDSSPFKAAYFDAAAACKQCHDDYRRR